MPDKTRKPAIPLPENVIPLFQNKGSFYEQNRENNPEAFRIQCKEIYYLSILFSGHENETRGQGFAVFKNGELIHFTIDGNGDEKVRERCIKAGERIASIFQSTLEYGTINHQGRFLSAAEG
ncbi:MAG: hypothetical protein ABR534_15690 [Desulfotignum sp.]